MGRGICEATKCGARKGQSLLSNCKRTVTYALDLGRCLALTRNESSSSLEAGFSQVDVVLDATKDSVIDRFFVA